MRLVWLQRARANRKNAIAWIARENPIAAVSQLNEILLQTGRLAEYPEMGRPGRQRGTRELVVNRTPFIIVYRIRPRAGRIEILRVMHGAQQRPEG
ncbi:MAG: type II toxin-antitoxin system RelE/ParE family toxin [Alphaproteobacteria bacterium]